MTSITVRPASASTSRTSPARVSTISLGIAPDSPICAARAAIQRRCYSFGSECASGPGMGLTASQLQHGIEQAAAIEPAFARAVERAGYPEPRIRERGYRTLLRTIVGQQVSVAAAASVWRKLEELLSEELSAQSLLEQDFDALRACGLSRQKQSYARSLCELVVSGALTLDDLPEDDEEAIARLVQVKGIGRWSAEIYLLFAEGRPDI